MAAVGIWNGVGMMRNLWPPVVGIVMALNSRVRASTQDAEPRMQEQTTGVDLPEGFYMRPTESVPPHIGEMIDRHVAANQAAYSGSPQPGLIVRLPSLEKLGVTCEIGVLLAQKTRQGTWRGWLAVGECDYAGVSDFVLQEEDGPFYSAFGMVQVWNPVEVKLPKRCDVLGTLSPDRMEAVYAMAREFKGSIAANAGPPFPGKVGLRKVGGYAVVTGTPLADPKDDPRWIYQRAYTGLARRLSQTSTSSAGALWAAAALKRSARALEQWTAGRQLAFTPQAVITHPLGQDADEPVNVGYRLEDLCELWLSIIESEGVIHVRVKRVGDAQLSVRLMRGDEPFLDEMLNQSQEEVQVSTEVDSGDVLILEDKSTQKTYSVPIT